MLTTERKVKLLGWELASSEEFEQDEDVVHSPLGDSDVFLKVSVFEAMHPWDILDLWVSDEGGRWAKIDRYDYDGGAAVILVISDGLGAWLGFDETLDKALWGALWQKDERRRNDPRTTQGAREGGVLAGV